MGSKTGEDVGREQHGVRSCVVGFVLIGLVLMSDTKTMRDTRTRGACTAYIL